MAQRLAPLIREQLGVDLLGYFPNQKDLAWESRYLGLTLPEEIAGVQETISRAAASFSENIPLKGILNIMENAPALEYAGLDSQVEDAPAAENIAESAEEAAPKVRIAVARDPAFCFYYEENMQILRALGAEIVPFSPIRDADLPENIHGMLLGGGYPEMYLEALEKNESMRSAIKQAIGRGMPVRAECGGFMYLHETMEDMEGGFWPMAGVIPGRAYRTKKLGRFGYITLTPNADTAFLPLGETVRAHEFHYFDSENCGAALTATKPDGARSWTCEHADGTLLAGFPHLYYESNPDLIVRFLRKCAERS